MKKNLELLNKVKDMLVKIANEKNIDLRSEFGTEAEFKKFTVAFAFKALTDMGVSTEIAYDAVLGEGEYAILFEKVWNSAN